MFNSIMNIKDIRCENARLLAKQSSPKTPIKGLAEKLGKSPALISHYIGKNPSKLIGEQTAREIERAFGLNKDWLDTPHFETNLFVEEELAVYDVTKGLIPVIGHAQLGDGGFWEANEFGDGYIKWHSDDPNAYAVQGIGESMSPRIKHNEFVIVEPNRTIFNGDEVFLITTDGRRMVKIYLYTRDGRVYLESTNNDFDKIILDVQYVVSMHYVAGITKSKASL